MKKTSFIIAAMMAAVMLVGCGKTTANVAPTTEYSEKVESTVKPVEPTKKVEEQKPAETPKKVEAVSIEAKVNGSHNIGETLSAKDFTITVNMSDGTKKKNPAGWTANPLALTTESTEITVAYNGLTTKVTVKANAAVVEQPEQTQPEAPKPEVKRPYPDSAYEPISQKAREDFYAYAYARGYETWWYEDPLGGMHENAVKYNIDAETGETYMDYAFLVDYYESADKWVIQYATPYDEWEIHEIPFYTDTLEFLYKLL